ncbi:MAG: bifunctional nuclease family protein [Spirochaetales bacterium]|nr:bifunctional nuclease family protein [Spirochaetales bacterium]
MLVEAEIWTIARTEQGNAVVVRPLGAETAVPIFIGQLEAQSILIGMQSVPMPRPLSHDLMLDLLKAGGLELLRIEIVDLQESTFIAQLVIKNASGDEVLMDCRPSDAISLAVRAKVPVYIAERIVDEAGISVKVITEHETIADENPVQKELEALRGELSRAVDVENYEEAARLRDKIQKLEDSNPELKG